jgi:hypothetical protein
MVIGAEHYQYQIWPIDESDKWTEVYGLKPQIKRRYSVTGSANVEINRAIMKTEAKAEEPTQVNRGEQMAGGECQVNQGMAGAVIQKKKKAKEKANKARKKEKNARKKARKKAKKEKQNGKEQIK